MFNTIPNNPFPPSSANVGGGGSPYVLPVASADTLGGVKVGAGLSIANGVLSSDKQVPDYSTTEQKTWQKWIDGKDIYFITVDFGALPNNNVKTLSCPVSIDKLIDIRGVTVNNKVLPYLYVTSSYSELVGIAYSSNDEIVISTNQDFSGDSAYVTLYYTKTESEG